MDFRKYLCTVCEVFWIWLNVSDNMKDGITYDWNHLSKQRGWEEIYRQTDISDFELLGPAWERYYYFLTDKGEKMTNWISFCQTEEFFTNLSAH